MTDQYLAAEERARKARRAGLQAKKDEQPRNTARSYAAKQREWKARSPPTFSSSFLLRLSLPPSLCLWVTLNPPRGGTCRDDY